MTYVPPPYEHPLRRRRRLDRVVRLIIVNGALGVGLGAAGALTLLAFDVLGLRTLLFQSDTEWVGVAAFVFLFGLAFGGVLAAFAAMRADDDDDEPRGGLRAPALAYAPVRAR